MNLTTKTDIVFNLLTLCILGAGLYHLYAAIEPTAVPTQSFVEHVFWVFANFTACYFLVKRTRYFIPLLFVWVLQQWYYHGGMALSIWNEQHQIAYPDIVVVLFMPMLLILYWWDTREINKVVNLSTHKNE